jgi:hypothetical protein
VLSLRAGGKGDTLSCWWWLTTRLHSVCARLQSKEELDKLELEQKERSAKEFDAALVRRAHCRPGFEGL